jgi:hypothetical protein
MDGFITESVGKISDGFLNAVKLLIFYFFLKIIIVPIQNFFHQPGVIIYTFILLALAAFELHRSLAVRTSDPARAWKGMAAGLYFWQAFYVTTVAGGFNLFQQIGVMFWVMMVLFTITLWRKVLPVGARMCLLVFLSCWMGVIYFSVLTLMAGWPPVILFGYEALRYLVGVIGLVSIFYIIFRSHDTASRSYAAIIVFNSVLYLLNAF